MPVLGGQDFSLWNSPHSHALLKLLLLLQLMLLLELLELNQLVLLLLFKCSKMLWARDRHRPDEMQLAGLVRTNGVGTTKQPTKRCGNSGCARRQQRVREHLTHFKKLVFDSGGKQHLLLKWDRHSVCDPLENLDKFFVRVTVQHRHQTLRFRQQAVVNG